MKIVFLGGGRITTAMLAGLRLAGCRHHLAVHDPHPRKLKRIKKEFAVTTEPSLAGAVAHADLLVVAVRPESVHDLLLDLQKAIPLNFKRGCSMLAVSLAAGVTLAALRHVSGKRVVWARAMPSPVCRTGNGLTALTFDRKMPSISRDQIRRVFASVGTVLEVPESQFDAFTVNYSSSHGYHALAALAEAAVANGLDRRIALLSAAHALADGIIAWRKGKIPLDRLLREAATPGGVAETTMAAMNRRGYQHAVDAGFRAGLARMRANASLGRQRTKNSGRRGGPGAMES
ncbi:MAG: NAD(P)-binding domain-containing protein [Acidobacteria bacterium]|nr:NAD(P)-binding domain-containing protein [Acidobacteriota bacterium]